MNGTKAGGDNMADSDHIGDDADGGSSMEPSGDSREPGGSSGEPGGDSVVTGGSSMEPGGDSVVTGDSSREPGDNSDVSGNDVDGMVVRLGGIAFDLEKQIKYKDLVNLEADELGILRNAIFAKHGYIFKTAKYSEYFSAFDWYEPALEDVGSRLTKDDKSGIALIQKVERFYEKSIKLSDDEKNMVGSWHLGAGVGAGYSDMYRFYEDGTYKYNISQMVMDERNLTHGGKWFVLDGYLYLRLEREGVLVGGELADAEHPGSATEKEIIDAEYMIRPLGTFKAVELKLELDSDMIEKDYYLGVVIGGMDFYKLSPDPEEFTRDLLDI
ncbi:MAG: YARHG domain-containing protein [Clostridiaceae bacterium]|jgi:hypothetical protein|nr:YARHG domain-containing protein [Clostridiaceae bacterium]